VRGCPLSFKGGYLRCQLSECVFAPSQRGALQRATPLAWLVGTLVVLWYAESGKDGAQARRRQPWYRHGPSLTFADMLASCRLQLWRHWLGQGSGMEAGQEEKWSWLLEYVATAT
jgi:hypothetical protein